MSAGPETIKRNRRRRRSKQSGKGGTDGCCTLPVRTDIHRRQTKQQWQQQEQFALHCHHWQRAKLISFNHRRSNRAAAIALDNSAVWEAQFGELNCTEHKKWRLLWSGGGGGGGGSQWMWLLTGLSTIDHDDDDKVETCACAAAAAARTEPRLAYTSCEKAWKNSCVRFYSSQEHNWLAKSATTSTAICHHKEKHSFGRHLMKAAKVMRNLRKRGQFGGGKK